jgi:hypothetical protein
MDAGTLRHLALQMAVALKIQTRDNEGFTPHTHLLSSESPTCECPRQLSTNLWYYERKCLHSTDTKIQTKDQDGRTPLHVCCIHVELNVLDMRVSLTPDKFHTAGITMKESAHVLLTLNFRQRTTRDKLLYIHVEFKILYLLTAKYRYTFVAL